MPTSGRLLAGIELGGTWCRCIAGTGPDDIRAEEDIPTRAPASTLEALARVLERWQGAFGELAALGLASFGPMELRQDSPRYGLLRRDAEARLGGHHPV